MKPKPSVRARANIAIIILTCNLFGFFLPSGGKGSGGLSGADGMVGESAGFVEGDGVEDGGKDGGGEGRID
ncbi:hypothetical protein SLA2020_342390 [Shorea laevis]